MIAPLVGHWWFPSPGNALAWPGADALQQSLFLAVGTLAGYLCGRIPTAWTRSAAASAGAEQDAARAAAAEALRATNTELSALVDASPLAICRVAPDGTVARWNPAAERLFGQRARDAIGHPWRMGLEGLEADELRQRVARGETLTGVETQCVRGDGTRADLSVSATPLHDTAGVPSGFLVVCQDITARKSLEAQFLQAQKMEAVGRLAAGVAHDFNNILTIINGAAEFLRAKVDPGDARQGDVRDILEASHRAASLTQQLLAFSRRQVLQPRVINLSSVVEGLMPMLKRLVGEDVTVVTRLAPALASIKADPTQLEQVILNLAVNARDAMPGGGTLTLETANTELDYEYPFAHPTARPGPHVLLVVRDTGIGMDAATRARIFEPFFTTKEPGRGTGLGLATVYGIVKQSGGNIWVYTEPGRGTIFKLYFPWHDDEREGVAPRPAASPASLPRTATLLLVEDEKPVRDLVQRVLRERGFTVLAAGSGREALVLASEYPDPIHLAISDVVMPGLSGPELLRELAQQRPGIGSLLMSGTVATCLPALASRAPSCSRSPSPPRPCSPRSARLSDPGRPSGRGSTGASCRRESDGAPT